MASAWEKFKQFIGVSGRSNYNPKRPKPKRKTGGGTRGGSNRSSSSGSRSTGTSAHRGGSSASSNYRSSNSTYTQRTQRQNAQTTQKSAYKARVGNQRTSATNKATTGPYKATVKKWDAKDKKTTSTLDKMRQDRQKKSNVSTAAKGLTKGASTLTYTKAQTTQERKKEREKWSIDPKKAYDKYKKEDRAATGGTAQEHKLKYGDKKEYDKVRKQAEQEYKEKHGDEIKKQYKKRLKDSTKREIAFNLNDQRMELQQKEGIKLSGKQFKKAAKQTYKTVKDDIDIAAEAQVNKEAKKYAKKVADEQVGKPGTLKSKDLSMEDFYKLQNASRIGGKLGNKALGKDLAEKVGSQTAYSAGKNKISKVTTGIMQGLAYGDVLHGGVGSYNKDAKGVLKDVKKSTAYNVGYGAGQMAGFMTSGTGWATKALTQYGVKAGAKATVKAGSKSAGKQFLKNRAIEGAIETPMNVLDAAKMSRDENGKVDTKEFAKYLAMNTAITGAAGGALEGIGLGITRAQGKELARLKGLQKSGGLDDAGKVRLQKLEMKLLKATEEIATPKSSIASEALGIKAPPKADSKEMVRLSAKKDAGTLTETEAARLETLTKEASDIAKQNDKIRADLRNSMQIKAETLNKLSKETGVEYKVASNDEIVKALKDNGKDVEDGVFINGVSLTTKDGKRQIFVNKESDQAHSVILGHETTHLLSGTKHFDALKNTVKDFADSLGEYDALRNEFKNIYDSDMKGMTKEEADKFLDEEVTSELVGRYLFGENAEKFVKQLSTSDRNVFQRIYGYIVDAIKSATGDAELRQLNAIKENFDKAYKEMGETTDTLNGNPKNNGAPRAEGRRFSSEEDVREYLYGQEPKSTKKRTVSEYEQGKHVVLTSRNEINKFIDDAIEDSSVVLQAGYGKVAKELSNAVEDAFHGKLDISDYYLELNPNDLRHVLDDELPPGAIPMTKEDLKEVPDWLDDFNKKTDYVFDEVAGKKGKKFKIGKRINGFSVIVTLVSDGRKSIRPKTVHKYPTDVFEQKYGGKIKKQTILDAQDKLESAPHLESSDGSTFDRNISQPNESVNLSKSKKPPKGGSFNGETRYSKTRMTKAQEKAMAKRDADEHLTKDQFNRLYSAHKLDMRKNGNVDEQIANIKSEGFKGDGGFGVNVTPASMNDYVHGYTIEDIRNHKHRGDFTPEEIKKMGLEWRDEAHFNDYIKDLKENPRGGTWVGDTFYPRLNVTQYKYGARKGDRILLVPEAEVIDGEKVRPGFKPKDYEIVTVERDFQPLHELYEKAFKEFNDKNTGEVKFSKSKRQKKKDAKREAEYNKEKDNPDILESAKSAKTSAEEKLETLKATRAKESEASEKLETRQKNIAKYGKQEGKEERLVEIRTQKAESDQRLAAIDKDIESVTKELKKAQKSIEDYERNQAAKPKTRKEKTKEHLTSEIKGFQSEIDSIKAEIRNKRNQLKELDNVDYSKMSKSEADAHLAKRNRIARELNPLQKKIDNLTADIKSRQKLLPEDKPKETIIKVPKRQRVQWADDVHKAAKVHSDDVTQMTDDAISKEINSLGFGIRNGKTKEHIELRKQRRQELFDEQQRRKEETPAYASLREDQLPDNDPGRTIGPDTPVRDETAPTEHINKTNLSEIANSAPDITKQPAWLRTFRRLVVNSYTAFEDYAKRTNNEKLLHQINNAQHWNNKFSAWVEADRSGMDRKISGKGLNAIFDDAKLFGPDNIERRNDFVNYLTYKHAIDRLKHDKPVHMSPEGGSLYSFDDYRSMMKEIEEKYTDDSLKNFEKDVRGYYDDIMKMRVDSGLVSKQFAEELQKKYPNYIPTLRDGDEWLENGTTQGSKQKFGIKDPIKVAKGGTQDVLDLYQASMRVTKDVIRDAEQNTLLRLYAEGLGVRPDKVDNLGELPSFAASAEKTKDGWRVTFFQDGQMVTMPVDKQIARGMREVNGQEFERLMWLASKTQPGMRWFKGLITDYNVLFGIRNGARDFQQAGVNSKSLKHFATNIPTAQASVLRHNTPGLKTDPWMKSYEANGGLYTNFVQQDHKFVEPGSKTGIKKGIDATAGRTLRALESVNSAIEATPRLAEYIGTIKKDVNAQLEANGSSLKKFKEGLKKELYGDKDLTTELEDKFADIYAQRILDMASTETLEKAARNASDITLNFSRNGVITKALNMGFVPYLNPSIQGLSKTMRMFTENGAEGWRSLLNFGMKVGGITMVPAVANEILCAGDRDYQNIATREKDTNFFIPLGDGKFIKIPKPRENSVMSEPVTYSLRHFFDTAQYGSVREGEYSGGEYWKRMFTTGIENIGPVNPLSDNLFSPIIRLAQNKTWYGGSIESVGEVLQKKEQAKNGEKVINSDIYDESTSALAIMIGQTKIGNTTVSDLTHMSPKKIDDFLDSYTGVIYDLGISQFTEVRNGNPILNQFVKDTVFSNKTGTELWAEFEKANSPKDLKGKAVQKAKDIVFGHNALNINEKTQAAKDWLNKKGYDDMTYSSAVLQIQTDKKMSEEKKQNIIRRWKRAQNDLRLELKYGKGEVHWKNDPLRTIADTVGVDKAMKKFTYTYENPETGEKMNQYLDAWNAYKDSGEYSNDKKGSSQKFLDFYTKSRWTNGRIGESKSYPQWMTISVLAATEKGNNDDIAKAFIRPDSEEFQQKVIQRGKNYRDFGYTQKDYRSSSKTLFKGGRDLDYEYTNQMQKYDKAMSLATSPKNHTDGAYYIASTGDDITRRMNYARCLDSKGYTKEEIHKFAKKNDLEQPKESSKWSSTQWRAYNEKVANAVREKYGDKSLEEQSAVYHVITGDFINEPFGGIGDYSLEGDSGIAALDARPYYGRGWGGRGYRRGRRGGWGGYGGYGGGGSGTGAMPDAKTSPVKTSDNYKATKAASYAKAKVSKPTVNAVGVKDYTKPSNLNDAYRKRAKKLRDSARKA